jgi:Carboxypeptidase activation peptide.
MLCPGMYQSVCIVFYVVKDCLGLIIIFSLYWYAFWRFYKGVLLNICFTHPLSGVDTWLRLAVNSSTVDVLVKAETADKVKEFIDSSGLTFDVVIDNLQAAIDAENITVTPEEMEELEGRKGEEFEFLCVPVCCCVVLKVA